MTENVDPYRYGAPAPRHWAPPTGKEILRASWEMLRQDRTLLWLPVLGLGTGLAGAAVLFVPGFLLGETATGWHRAGFYVGGLFAAFALSVASTYFESALVIGAFERAEGRTPTLRGVLAAAWVRKRQVLGWALVSSTVGVALRAIEERAGIAGRLLGFLAGLAWTVATFLALPVLVAERVGPVTAAKRSGQLIRHTWGTSLRTTVRVGVGATLLGVPLMMAVVAGVVFLAVGFTVVGIALIVFGMLGALLLGAAFSAALAYAQAMIYRYAVGQPVPGLPATFWAGAFEDKRRRWGR